MIIISVNILLPLLFLLTPTRGGMREFLKDSCYSITSMRDDGALTLSSSPHSSYKVVKTEKWVDQDSQKWILEDFQSIGKYELTPLVYNRTRNIVTYQFTRNPYTHKRQWRINMIATQRYQIQNPESGHCLTNMGLHNQVDENNCDPGVPSNQVWKFRMLRKA